MILADRLTAETRPLSRTRRATWESAGLIDNIALVLDESRVLFAANGSRSRSVGDIPGR